MFRDPRRSAIPDRDRLGGTGATIDHPVLLQRGGHNGVLNSVGPMMSTPAIVEAAG
jgi:hypothetical protein